MSGIVGREAAIRETASLIKLGKLLPQYAVGHPRIDLTDPVTGKAKERIEGDNHVFVESLMGIRDAFGFSLPVSDALLALTDSTESIVSAEPYLIGQAIGYGRPSQGSSGLYRGAYSAANQVLAAQTLASTRWVFQYDFTTAQANGVIGTVGLTHQYQAFNTFRTYSPTGYLAGSYLLNMEKISCDGRYTYSVATTGIITVYDYYLRTSSTIDVSATVGTTSTTYKSVCIGVDTSYYYIFASSSTSSARKVYVFTDNTFSSLVTMYSPSNITNVYNATRPMFVYGNYLYIGQAANTIYKADFVNNVNGSNITISTYSFVSQAEDVTNYSTCYPNNGAIPYNSTRVWFGTGGSLAVLYDFSTDTIVAYSMADSNRPQYLNPLTTEKLICSAEGTYNRVQWSAAIAAYKLPAPVTKTSANGMTATYELKVFW